ncbi:unnamed protein product [Echinostoma caproni]|uniref:G_PROTEIN_RECEP_F1_2 domain-containing protein n=1 Tax=Echinostoma caproni TaxID=27848 RepID=A0A183ABE7_9TREM|nr:unnamed protein product [Echinostoma caproni]
MSCTHIQDSAMKIAAAIIYPSIILLSTVGNSIVILTVIRSVAMRTITNLFIANLAVSDLLMTFVSTPFTPLAFYMKGWKLPSALCHLLPMTMGTSVYVSTLTSTAIAVDRYLVIVHPFVSRMSETICGLIIASVWLFSILVTLPLGIYQEIKVDPVTKDANCEQSWPDKGSQPVRKVYSIYTVITFVLQFVVPCFIISICYYRVSCVLRARCDLKIGSGQKSREREESDIRRKRRTNKMLIAMVVIFVLCWIPLHALWIIVDSVGGQIEESWHFHNAFIFCHMLAMSSAVYNPFLYAWLNNNFRQEFQAILQCRGKTQGPRNMNRSDNHSKIVCDFGISIGVNHLCYSTKTNIRNNSYVPFGSYMACSISVDCNCYAIAKLGFRVRTRNILTCNKKSMSSLSEYSHTHTLLRNRYSYDFCKYVYICLCVCGPIAVKLFLYSSLSYKPERYESTFCSS